MTTHLAAARLVTALHDLGTNNGGATAAELAIKAGLGRSTVSTLLGSWLADGHVVKDDGRPARYTVPNVHGLRTAVGGAIDADLEENAPADLASAPAIVAEPAKEKAPRVPRVPQTPAEKAEALVKRGRLPEGYVSVMGLTHEINARGLYYGKRADGLTGQSLYTYINANGEGSKYPFPIVRVDGKAAIELEAGLAWWVAKNERAASKAAK